MHVLLIHQAYAGPRDPGGTRHHELATYLASRGHRTTIIASEVSYLTGTAVAAGDTEETPGVRVIRLPGSELHRSFVARGTAFAQFGARALKTALSIPDVDVVWGTTPPLPQLMPAWLASLRAKGGLVVEERDLWPEFAIGMGVLKPGAVTDAALAFKRWVYRRAKRVVINSPGFLPFLKSYGVDEAKIHVVPNGVDPTPFDPELRGEAHRAAWGADDRFVALYAGALGPANALDVVLDAADALRGTRALFVLVGDGKARPDLERAASERGLDNVRFVPAVPKDQVPGVLAAADACLACLRDIPLFRTTYPNKVFDYMAAGRPTLLQIDGVIRQVVEEAHAGLFVPPGDAHALASAVRQMMDHPDAAREMGRRGRKVVCERFDRRLQGEQIEALFAELVPSAPRARRAAKSDDAARVSAVKAALATGRAGTAGRTGGAA
ncbi:MAG: glycosyltransferase family 4 protein [Candidatus Binatia bacterium]